MPFSSEDKVMIEHYWLDKGYGERKLLTEFPNRHWTLRGLRNLIKKTDQTGSIDLKKGSGCPRSAQTNDNIKYAEEEISRQETNPGSHSTPAEISKRLDISESCVRKVVKNNLKLKPFNQTKGQVLSLPDEQKRIHCTKNEVLH